MSVLGIVVLMPTLALSAGELNGRIRGHITEKETKLPVAAAVIVAKGPRLIGGPMEVMSEDDGSYILAELPPGPYTVEISYAGSKPLIRKVAVRQGETMPLDVVWSEDLLFGEEIVVNVERHLTRPDSTHTGTVLSFDTEKNIATQRTYTDVAQQVAGLKSDRGLPVVKGANRISNRYMVDGMDITDSVTNNFATQINFDSISSLEVLTGGMEAQYNALGGVINVNTNGGSDEFKLDTSFYFNHQALSAQNTYGTLLHEHELVFDTSKLGPRQSYLASANISGPIAKQKLWYGLSFEYDYYVSSLLPGPPLDVQHPARREHQFHPRLKLTYAPAMGHRLTWSSSADPAIVANREPTNSGLGITGYGQTQGGFFTVLQWDYYRSQYFGSNVQAGFNYNTVHQIPIGRFFNGAYLNYGPRDPRFSDLNYQYDPERPQHTNTVDGTVWWQGRGESENRRYTWQVDPSLIVRGQALGDHDAKFGIQSRAVYQTFRRHVPGGATYRDGNGAPLEAGLCDPETGTGCLNSQVTYSPDFRNHAWGFGIGAYAQDRWKVWRRLTILPGVRFDFGTTQNSVGEVVSRHWGIGPRLGFALDLTGDQKTILTAFYGRANDTLNLLAATRADPADTSETHRWDPRANGGSGGFVFVSSQGGREGYKLNPNGKPPHTDEITGGINREIFSDSVASINYTYKKMSNIWSEIEINQIWDPSGQRVVGYVDGIARAISMFTTPDEAYRHYHGVDFAVESRPSKNWDLYGAYTLSWTFGTGSESIRTVGGGNAFANPRQFQFYDGFLPEDSRHSFKAHASYHTHGFTAGVNLNFSTGQPLTKLYYNAFDNLYTNRRSPQGTTPSKPNDPAAYASFRTPDLLLISLRVSYDFHELIKQHIIVIADLFNVFNLDTPTTLEARDVPTFGAANRGRIEPLRAQLAIRYMY